MQTKYACLQYLQTHNIYLETLSNAPSTNHSLLYENRTKITNKTITTINNQRNQRVDGNRDHKLDHRRQGGGGRNDSNHCESPPALGNDAGLIVANALHVGTV